MDNHNKILQLPDCTCGAASSSLLLLRQVATISHHAMMQGLTCWGRALSSRTPALSRTIPTTWNHRPPPAGYMPRAEMITEEHIGNTYLVHSGRDHKRVKVTAQMVMHKFGEFVLTRKPRPKPKKSEQKRKR